MYFAINFNKGSLVLLILASVASAWQTPGEVITMTGPPATVRTPVADQAEATNRDQQRPFEVRPIRTCCPGEDQQGFVLRKFDDVRELDLLSCAYDGGSVEARFYYCQYDTISNTLIANPEDDDQVDCAPTLSPCTRRRLQQAIGGEQARGGRPHLGTRTAKTRMRGHASTLGL